MAIIINDFEIIVEQPAESKVVSSQGNNDERQDNSEDNSSSNAPLRPEDIASVIQFYQERATRLSTN